MALSPQQPLLPTPSIDSKGSVSKPKPLRKATVGVPKLAAPTVVKPHPRGPLGLLR